MLKYKAIQLGKDIEITSEKFTSVTCSTCLQKTGPSGLSNLSIREWICNNCRSLHDRDINAAKNILTFGLGHETLLGESPLGRRGCQVLLYTPIGA